MVLFVPIEYPWLVAVGNRYTTSTHTNIGFPLLLVELCLSWSNLCVSLGLLPTPTCGLLIRIYHRVGSCDIPLFPPCQNICFNFKCLHSTCFQYVISVNSDYKIKNVTPYASVPEHRLQRQFVYCFLGLFFFASDKWNLHRTNFINWFWISNSRIYTRV